MSKHAKENKELKDKFDPNRIVLIGDSITEFWWRDNPSFFEGKHLVNRGISGQTTSQMIARFDTDVIQLQPAAVVILAGINDIAENTGPISIDHIFTNIVTMVNTAQRHNIKVILSSVLPAREFPWRPGLQPAKKVLQLNAKLLSYAKENELYYIDYYSSMRDENNGLDSKYSADGVHPNRAGYAVMARLLDKAIQKAALTK